MTRLDLIKPGMNVMHIAPERGLFDCISRINGVDYDCFDINPRRYPFAPVKRLDLASDLPGMPSNTYDVIIHSHVMEHVFCNVTVVLLHLNRILKPRGLQLCVIPFLKGHYSEDLGELSEQERLERFGQKDHVRRFGAKDVKRTVGMAFRLPESYDVEPLFGAETLKGHSIPESAWRGFGTNTVLMLRKEDCLIQG